MSDYIDDFDFSSLSIDDIFDIAFGPPNGPDKCDSLGAHFNLAPNSDPDPSSSGMPYDHFDNPFAAPFPVAQTIPPLHTDAMTNEHFMDGTKTWSSATLGNQRSHRASSPCDTVFAPNFVSSNKSMTFNAFDPMYTETRQFDLDQPRYFVIDTHAAQLPPAATTARIQHHKNVTPPVSGMRRSRKHVCNIAPCNGATFGRGPELRRHHASKHDVARFWCPIDGCHRSKMEGGRAFARKDKMVDHLMKVHGDRVGSTA